MTEEKIQDYVNGSLPEAEAAEVAAALAADPALARLAEQYRTIFRGLRQQRAKEIEKELLQFDQAGPNDSGNKNGPGKFWLWGGGLLLLLLLAFGGIQQKRNFSDPALAKRFFQLPPDPRLAGPEPDESRVYFQAIDDFYESDYENAIAGFSGLQSSNDYGAIARFYLPHAHFLNGDYPAADQSFSTALGITDLTEADRERLAWNAMITELALGENISDLLDQEWGRGYPVDELRAALDSFWR